MSCIGGVFYNCGNISGWPPLPYPLFSSPPQQPPQQPPPNPPPPQAYVQTKYYLSFPPLVGVNVEVFWVDLYDNAQLIPSTKPIALGWQFYPTAAFAPRIFTTTTNQLFHTRLRSLRYNNIYSRGYTTTYILDIGAPPPSKPLLIAYFLFHQQRWITTVYEVYFPPMPEPRSATPEDYRLALQSRKEKLVVFYDSELNGYGYFLRRHLIIELSPTEASIRENFWPYPRYYIRPTQETAYCMFMSFS